MNFIKKKHLEDKGWKVGDVKDFLQLTEEENNIINKKIINGEKMIQSLNLKIKDEIIEIPIIKARELFNEVNNFINFSATTKLIKSMNIDICGKEYTLYIDDINLLLLNLKELFVEEKIIPIYTHPILPNYNWYYGQNTGDPIPSFPIITCEILSGYKY